LARIGFDDSFMTSGTKAVRREIGRLFKGLIFEIQTLAFGPERWFRSWDISPAEADRIAQANRSDDASDGPNMIDGLRMAGHGLQRRAAGQAR